MEISGDENRYLQILLNFLSNSLKFTNNGSVRIEVVLVDTQDIATLEPKKSLGEVGGKTVQEII
jgi:signal transduction histidine kinase